MKQHLVNLLYEYYKQIYLSDRLHELGIKLPVRLENWEIVMDMVGIPKENWKEDENETQGNIRNWLYNKYLECIANIEKDQIIKVRKRTGEIKINERINEQSAKQHLSEYMDLVYYHYSMLKAS
jgi:hypothetical protein